MVHSVRGKCDIMFYIVIPRPKDRNDPTFNYDDTATNLKSARSKVYHLLKTYPERIFVFDADPTKFKSTGDIIRHTRGSGFKRVRYYWMNVSLKTHVLKADGTIERV